MAPVSVTARKPAMKRVIPLELAGIWRLTCA
jgi:hypothetical protein